MKNYAGLDVSLEETAIAIVDETGRTVREAKLASEIEAIDAWLGKTGIAIVRLGLEAGPLSSWLHAGLKERGWPAICIETRRLRAVTRAMPVLAARAALLKSFGELHALVLRIVKADAVCRQLMTIPSIGAVNALAYKTGIDDPTRFRHSADVGPHFGLTPRRYESGETELVGPISKCGDAMVRSLLFEAAMTLLHRVKAASILKRWARALAKKIGTRKAAVALARRLAVIMHRMWLDGTDFNPSLIRATAT